MCCVLLVKRPMMQLCSSLSEIYTSETMHSFISYSSFARNVGLETSRLGVSRWCTWTGTCSDCAVWDQKVAPSIEVSLTEFITVLENRSAGVRLRVQRHLCG